MVNMFSKRLDAIEERLEDIVEVVFALVAESGCIMAMSKETKALLDQVNAAIADAAVRIAAIQAQVGVVDDTDVQAALADIKAKLDALAAAPAPAPTV